MRGIFVRFRRAAAVEGVRVSLDQLWWAQIETFDELADATLARSSEAGATSVVIGVVDVAGDLHFVSTDADIAPEPMSWLSSMLAGETATPAALPTDTAGTPWLVLSLLLGPRPVGAVAICLPAAPASDDWSGALRAELAIAVDLVAARYGRRLLRAGLGALRRVSSRFSGALNAEEIAQCATNEAVAALGASGCLVYQLDDDLLELVAEGDAAYVTRPWEQIGLATSAPVTDCVRLNEIVSITGRDDIVARYPFMVEHSDVPDQAWLALPLVV